ncbi:uncharacterized protein IL334_003488 [Kwoniella shivajii]|uniref:Histone deacetylase domain-containing protein n=1 Tax=Kwoniella shivajii TaxID=564305 RepID=A0ABZ1CZG3_9TREE|nr:hypothetical protein IL334_003488 [Kwoniella shivajii]
MGSESAPRVSYIWSQELQDVSDDLPSNIGRSSMVHGLIRALDLLDIEATSVDGNDDLENGECSRKATVVAPDESLGMEDCLLKYHDKAYVDALMTSRATSPPARDPTAPRSPTLKERERPTKRARTNKESRSNSNEHLDGFNLSHDNPIFPSLPRYISMIASSTSTACKLLVEDKSDFVICWDGGRHHAKKSQAGGFCYVNDLVLGLLLISKEGKIPLTSSSSSSPTPSSSIGQDENQGVSQAVEQSQDQVHTQSKKRKRTVSTRSPRILYLDLDLHYSDGVSSAFHSTKTYPDPATRTTTTTSTSASKPTNPPIKPPSVLTFSIHHSSTGFYPPSTSWSELTSPRHPTPFSLAIPLKAYPSSRTYKKIWDGCVEPIVKEWNPDYIMVQLGSDGLPNDRVGQYGNWSVHDQGGMNWCIEKIKNWKKKTCFTGGGGYNHPNSARAWATVTSTLLGRPISAETPIPHHDHFDEYAHSFTMEVPEGHMEDQNDPEYIKKACDDFEYISRRIKDIVATSAL